MNKILIKDLLNNQKEENDITKINNELFQICSYLPNYSTFVPTDIIDSFASILAKLVELKYSSKDANTDVKTTYQICTIMEEILKHIPTEQQRLEKEDEEPVRKDSTVKFNIMTKYMMNKNKTSLQSYRGHRFSNNNTMVLEQWYSEHYQKPYLTKNSLETLSKTTNLSKIQIRNWVSNRRRKEKTVQVSPVILKLVQDK